MGNIGPARQRYEVLPIPEFGVQDADLWTLDLRQRIDGPIAEPPTHSGDEADVDAPDSGVRQHG